MSEQLTKRIARLEATEAIRNRIAEYAYAGDRKNDAALFRPLFTDDAVWSCEGFGSFQGRENILAGLAEVAREQVLWSLHFAVAPIITLNDDVMAADAYWWLWELSTLREGDTDSSSFMGGNYRARLVCDGAVWRFKHIQLSFQTITPFRDGWNLIAQNTGG